MPARSMDDIADVLKKVSFKRKAFGGVDEDDVWRVIKRLQAEYRNMLEDTKERYEDLLDESKDIIRNQRSEIAKLKEKLSSVGGSVNG